MTTPRIRLRAIQGRQVNADQHELRERAAALFPGSAHLQEAWFRAQRILAGCKPRVEIAGAHCDIKRFPRTLREAGINRLDETLEVPRFLRVFG